MFAAIRSLFSAPPHQTEAHEAYVALVSQARRPFFYADCAVPDTLDGRFDLIILHMFLVIHRLRGEPQGTGAAGFIRALQEVFFSDMDRSLREMGSSDTGVGKRIKKMAQAFYGRLQAYEQGVENKSALKESIVKNIYRGEAPSDAQLEKLADYLLKNVGALEKQDAAAIIAGQVQFLD